MPCGNNAYPTFDTGDSRESAVAVGVPAMRAGKRRTERSQRQLYCYSGLKGALKCSKTIPQPPVSLEKILYFKVPLK